MSAAIQVLVSEGDVQFQFCESGRMSVVFLLYLEVSYISSGGRIWWTLSLILCDTDIYPSHSN